MLKGSKPKVRVICGNAILRVIVVSSSRSTVWGDQKVRYIFVSGEISLYSYAEHLKRSLGHGGSEMGSEDNNPPSSEAWLSSYNSQGKYSLLIYSLFLRDIIYSQQSCLLCYIALFASFLDIAIERRNWNRKLRFLLRVPKYTPFFAITLEIGGTNLFLTDNIMKYIFYLITQVLDSCNCEHCLFTEVAHDQMSFWLLCNLITTYGFNDYKNGDVSKWFLIFLSS